MCLGLYSRDALRFIEYVGNRFPEARILTIVKELLWFSLGLVLYVYVGYHLALSVISPLWTWPRKMDEQYPPSTSLIIAAYNEEKIIAEKIKNGLALDNPKNLLGIA